MVRLLDFAHLSGKLSPSARDLCGQPYRARPILLSADNLPGHIHTLLGILGVEIGPDLFGVLRGEHRAPHHHPAGQALLMVSSMLFRVVVIRADSPTRGAWCFRTASATAAGSTSFPRSMTV